MNRYIAEWLETLPPERWSSVLVAAELASYNYLVAWNAIARWSAVCGRQFYVLS